MISNTIEILQVTHINTVNFLDKLSKETQWVGKDKWFWMIHRYKKKTKNKVYTLNKTLRWSKNCNVKCDAMYNHQEITGEESN